MFPKVLLIVDRPKLTRNNEPRGSTHSHDIGLADYGGAVTAVANQTARLRLQVVTRGTLMPKTIILQ